MKKDRPLKDDAILIMEAVTGSQSYGTSTAGSDTDYFGIFVDVPAATISGYGYQEHALGPGDRSLFELRKAVAMFQTQNPAALELLWAEEADIILDSSAYRILREARSSILSKEIRDAFGGHARQQLHRIRSHQAAHHGAAPKEEPKALNYISLVSDLRQGGTSGKTFDLAGHELVQATGDILLAYQKEGARPFNSDGSVRRSQSGKGAPSFVLKFDKKEYRKAQLAWKNHQTWLAERSPQRTLEELRFGYDTKNAMHLVRLYRMGIEALQDGVLQVRRPDAEELLAIRRGELSYKELLKLASDLEEKLHQAHARSDLPETVDEEKMAHVLMRAYEAAWEAADYSTRPRTDRVP